MAQHYSEGTLSISDNDEWDAVLTAKTGWLDWQLREMWDHRDLLRLLVWRDFVTVHKQTVLGPMWHVINPVLTALTYTVVFGHVVRISTNDLPPTLFYMSGIVAWNYFAACLHKTSNALAANAGLFGKVYFHRLVVPLASVISSFISFGIQFAIFAAMTLVFRIQGADVHPNAWLLALPVLIGMLAALGLALGLVLSALTTRYRDLTQVLAYATQLLMFATPIIYPLSAAGDRYRWLIGLNPLSSIIETFRYACLGRGTPHPLGLVVTGCLLFPLLAIAISGFMRAQRTFVDTV